MKAGEYLGFNPKHVYPFNRTVQSIESIAEQVNIDLDIDESTLVFLFVGDDTERFFEVYNLSSSLHLILIEDFTRSMVSNYSLYYNHFISTFYDEDNNNYQNKLLRAKIEKFKGLPSKVLNKYSILIYITLNMMEYAIMNSNIMNSEQLRQLLYLTEFDTPIGSVKLLTNNHLTQYDIIKVIGKDGVMLDEYDFPRPIYPIPFHQLDNNNQYYDMTFNGDDDGILKLKKTVAIIYFQDIKNLNSVFINYMLARIVVEETNNKGGIKGYEIITEIYQCPVDEEESSSKLLSLKKRGIYIIIGGCDPIHRNYMRSDIEELNMVFFYTGFNSGSDCSKNMYIYY